MTLSLTRRALLLGAFLVCLAWLILEAAGSTRSAVARLDLAQDARTTVEALLLRRSTLQAGSSASTQSPNGPAAVSAASEDQARRQLQSRFEAGFPGARQQVLPPSSPEAQTVSGRVTWVGSEAEFRSGLEAVGQALAGLEITSLRVRPVITDEQNALEVVLDYSARWEAVQP